MTIIEKTNFKKPKKYYLFTILILIFFSNKGNAQDYDYPIKPVPFTSVKVNDRFWAPKIKINHDVTIPHSTRSIPEPIAVLSQDDVDHTELLSIHISAEPETPRSTIISTI